MRYLTVLAGLMMSLVVAGSVSAQEPQSPGKEHEELKSLEGTWDAVLKMADGSETKAVSEFKMTCEGMWLASDFHGDFGGLKFHGKGLDSYDPARKQYVSIWVDSMTGSPLIMTGTKKGNVTTLTGEGPGPTGVAKYKSVTTQESADRMLFRMLAVAGEKETEVMSVTYERRK